MAKIALSTIQEELKQRGWEVLSEEYKNLETEMTFRCPEGHLVQKSWGKLRNKFECPTCLNNVLKIKKTRDIDIKGKKITLALDQATKITGYSVYCDDQLYKYGTFEAQGSDPTERIKTVKEWMLSMIEQYKPSIVAFEGIQLQSESGFSKGVTVFQSLAELLGVLKETCLELGIQYEVCHTATWRSHCNVRGRSRIDKKRSMQALVKEWYDVSVLEDEADAIGIGKYAAETVSRKLAQKVESWE